ncbi:UDP-glucose/GDP-mannose dehydrogenase family protein, partial [Synergistaceae bacterium OttesenSCG-928-I11]|nr:UDP-glucose/GDP-mannose dehydrogenase family protein [Synergistaceae bacterium OttesenSCG-928-I11]
GRLSFTTDLNCGLEAAEICFIAVGTPAGENGETDMTQVLAVADQIGTHVNNFCFIVVKSTVPVGTNRLLYNRIESRLRERGIEHAVEIISNPEFLKEGAAVADCLSPDRVIVGAASERACETMKTLYRSFVPEEKIILMDPASAEITKYAANAMLAARISFMNEIARLCDAAGADILRVRDGIAADRRIGPYFLNAGCGYGGSCFPKDVQSLSALGEEYGLDMTLISAIEKVNRRQKKILSQMIRHRFGEQMEGLKIAVLGLAFKPETDDMREAPSVALIKSLLEYGATVAAYDPIAQKQASQILPSGVLYAQDPGDAIRDADATVIVTEWHSFESLDWETLGRSMRRKIIFDGRNMLTPEEMITLGFEYYCIGRNRAIANTPFTQAIHQGGERYEQ